jgi:hypothetical protein
MVFSRFDSSHAQSKIRAWGFSPIQLTLNHSGVQFSPIGMQTTIIATDLQLFH